MLLYYLMMQYSTVPITTGGGGDRPIESVNTDWVRSR